jgi:GNAT superfamily N-acetyltransferase
MNNLMQVTQEFLLDLSDDYPYFENWYNSKVLDGALKGERNIYIEYCDSKIIAVAIIKKTLEENKICTFRVLPEYWGKGIGSSLMNKILKIFTNEEPIITVSENKIDMFKPLLEKFNFKCYKKQKGIYLPERTEFYFKKEQKNE